MNDDENGTQAQVILSSRKEDFLEVKNFDRALNKFDKSKVKYLQNCLAYFFHYRQLYEYDKCNEWPIFEEDDENILYDEWKFR